MSTATQCLVALGEKTMGDKCPAFILSVHVHVHVNADVDVDVSMLCVCPNAIVECPHHLSKVLRR